MFNVPLKLRQRQGHCTPKGPTIQQARRVQSTLDGTTLEFYAPRHRSSYRARAAYVVVPAKHYNFAEETFRVLGRDNKENEWRNLKLFYRSWSFYGPWFTGHCAELGLVVHIVTPSRPKPGVSFFHPRAFEGAIADLLTYMQGNEVNSKGKARWMAPMQWQPVTTLPCVAACYEVRPVRETHATGDVSRRFVFPIGDRYLVTFNFSPMLIASGDMEDREKEIDPAPVNQLIDDIVASVKLTLSPEAQAQQAKALEGINDTSLTPTFPPLKWGDGGSEPQGTDYKQLKNG